MNIVLFFSFPLSKFQTHIEGWLSLQDEAVAEGAEEEEDLEEIRARLARVRS